MKELGRRGGKRAHGVKPERIHESLRSYLKREVPPERVWQALEAAMLGNNESARVSASRVLMDALHEPEQQENRARERAIAAAETRQHLANELARRAAHIEERRMRDLIGELSVWLQDEAVDLHPDVSGPVVGQTTPEAAEAIFRGLEEVGLLVRASKVDEMVEKRALELLEALKQEHGIPA